MKKPITMPRIVNSADVQWGAHPRFAGVQMKSLLTRVDNELANVNMVQVPPGNQVGWHVHGTQVETIFLLSGQAVLAVDSNELPISAGCIAAIPVGAEHSLRNVGSEPIELIAFFTPPNI